MKILVEKPTKKRLDELEITKWGTWGCEASTFDWHYDEKEICYLLEGEVTVKTDTEEVTFGQGDLVTFPQGLSCVWEVHKPVQKYYKFG